MRQAGKLGRLAPHPKSTHPRVSLEDHFDLSKIVVPPVVDRASKVSSWPMYLNDQLGDCTAAGVGHAEQALSAYGGTEVDLTDNTILKLYEATGGYVPGDPSTDNGAVMQDVLDYWQKNGVAGHKIDAYAELEDFYHTANLRKALYLFGTVYLGINFPSSAMDQFNNGLPWRYEAGSPIEGGHCIVLQKMNQTGTPDILDIVTWGELHPMNIQFSQHYVEEAWVVIDKEWITASGTDVDGFSLDALIQDFNDMTGQ